MKVTTKTYESTGFYLFLKLFKKGADGECYIDQRATLTVPEFQVPINNVGKINMGLQAGKREQITAGALKRTEKWFREINQTLN